MKEFDPGDAPSIASLTDQVRKLAVGMPVTSIHFLGDTAVFIGAEETAAMVMIITTTTIITAMTTTTITATAMAG